MTGKSKILIVDEKKENLSAMKEILRDLETKAEVVTASGGNDALDTARHHEFALIILDVRMAEMSGYELAERLRAQYETRTVPLIFLSAVNCIDRSSDRPPFKGCDSGAVDFLPQPSAPRIIVDKARVFVELDQQKKELAALLKIRQSLNEDIIRTNAELQNARASAEAANRAKSGFLAKMTHEFRTPLNAILGFSKLVGRSKNLNPEEERNLNIIRRSGEHLLTLINDVLDMSKIEAGAVLLNKEEFNLRNLLDNLTEMFSLKAEKQGLTLVFDCDAGVPDYIRADESKLRQILMNLLNNAFKFTKEGSIHVSVSMSNEETLSFEVRDTGEGIAANDINHLFDAFIQTGADRKFRDGTGLGLAISRKFVKMMGGDISVESEPGKGSKFGFTVHVNYSGQTDAAHHLPPPPQRMVRLAPDQPHYRILVADGHETYRMLLSGLLVSLGFDVREAKNGRETAEIRKKWNPHLIFMDRRMPVMGDGSAAREILEAGSRNIPVIATAYRSIQEGGAARNHNILCKPFKETEVFNILQQHLGVRYVHKNRQESHEDNFRDVLTPEAFSELPPDLLAKLERTSVMGDTEGAQKLIQCIRTYNAKLADALAGLTADFDHEQILTLLQKAGRQGHLRETGGTGRSLTKNE